MSSSRARSTDIYPLSLHDALPIYMKLRELAPDRSSPSEPDDGLAMCEQLLELWRTELAPEILPTLGGDWLDRSNGLLDEYRNQIEPFDCFRLGGWKPSEIELSDVIAALLDPAQHHGLGTSLLL